MNGIILGVNSSSNMLHGLYSSTGFPRPPKPLPLLHLLPSTPTVPVLYLIVEWLYFLSSLNIEQGSAAGQTRLAAHFANNFYQNTAMPSI